MSTSRRLAAAGAFAVPLFLILAGTSNATTTDGPHQHSITQTSIDYAGVGGAGSLDGQTTSGHHGSWWTDQNASVAGPGGAAVLHHSASGTSHAVPADGSGSVHHHGNWKHGNDSDNGTGTVAAHPASQGAQQATQHDPETSTADVERDRPSRHRDHDVSYIDETVAAGVHEASSSKVTSHAGDDYAVYQSSTLTAGQSGAISQGVDAIAVPGQAEYTSWFTSADSNGAVVHKVSSVAGNGHHSWTSHHEDDDI